MNWTARKFLKRGGEETRRRWNLFECSPSLPDKVIFWYNGSDETREGEIVATYAVYTGVSWEAEGELARSFPPYWFSKLKYNAYKYTFEIVCTPTFREEPEGSSVCEIRAGRSWTVRVGKGMGVAMAVAVAVATVERGRSIVTYIKIPISRLLITSTVYHAKQGRWTDTEVSILQTGGDSLTENLESTGGTSRDIRGWNKARLGIVVNSFFTIELSSTIILSIWVIKHLLICKIYINILLYSLQLKREIILKSGVEILFE